MMLNRLIGANRAVDSGAGAKARAVRLVESDSLILSEQARSITEPKYPDSILFGWMSGKPKQSAGDRMEADRRSVTREMERAFA